MSASIFSIFVGVAVIEFLVADKKYSKSTSDGIHALTSHSCSDSILLKNCILCSSGLISLSIFNLVELALVMLSLALRFLDFCFTLFASKLYDADFFISFIFAIGVIESPCDETFLPAFVAEFFGRFEFSVCSNLTLLFFGFIGVEILINSSVLFLTFPSFGGTGILTTIGPCFLIDALGDRVFDIIFGISVQLGETVLDFASVLLLGDLVVETDS